MTNESEKKAESESSAVLRWKFYDSFLAGLKTSGALLVGNSVLIGAGIFGPDKVQAAVIAGVSGVFLLVVTSIPLKDLIAKTGETKGTSS